MSRILTSSGMRVLCQFWPNDSLKSHSTIRHGPSAAGSWYSRLFLARVSQAWMAVARMNQL